MKLFDTILLSLSVACLIIGVHQLIVITNNTSFAQGLLHSYWLFMLTLVLFLYYNLRKNRRTADPGTDAAAGTRPVASSTPKTTAKSRKTR